MKADLTKCNETLTEFARLIKEKTYNHFIGELKTGVDLGTANIVISVVDEEDRPIAGVMSHSSAVRDGVVVDYLGAIETVRALKAQLEERLGVSLTRAATAIPPKIAEESVKVISNVVEAAGFMVTNIIDEPTAAAFVTGLTDGAVVDVGGGTTGISIIKEGEVVFTNDEATGGTHMTLVLSGAKSISIEEGEALKKDPEMESEVFMLVKPVVEKMAAIIKRQIGSSDVKQIYVVGGACSFSEFEHVFEQYTGIETIKPKEPLLVTPLGIAMNCQ